MVFVVVLIEKKVAGFILPLLIFGIML